MAQSIWRDKYKSLKDYYSGEYKDEYYKFDEYELSIDPDETLEQINAYEPVQRRREEIKCAVSFPYFAHKYIKILHPKEGLVPFILYRYQQGVIQEYEDYRFNIIRKFRQGGLTTVTEIWGLWRCLFKLEQQILFLSKTDSEAIAAGEIVNTAAKELPVWMQPNKEGKWNDHKRQFPETGGNMHFGTPERARGLAITYLILDEAAFIPDMEKHWKAMYPTLSLGGNCVVISTVNGLGNWYQKTFYDARDKKNDFNVIDLQYTSHPDYNKPKWVKEQKAQLGEKGWLQEVLGNFLGSGETYIPSYVIARLQERTKTNLPKRKVLNKWASGSSEEHDSDWTGDGAMWIWQERKLNHEYIIGVDCSEGVGEDGDNSVIEVFDHATLEQVAEFYSNSVVPYVFAGIVNQIAIYYNNALVVVEANGPGGAVLSRLQYEMYYDNLYYDSEGKGDRPGVRTGPTNRPLIFESLQHRLMNDTAKINSHRFVDELTTFIYNKQTQKIQATKGHHDDAIMAIALALYVRDTMHRELPLGENVPENFAPIKALVFDEIKKEIMEGAPEDFLFDDKPDLIGNEDDELQADVVYQTRRKFSKILEEFGW